MVKRLLSIVAMMAFVCTMGAQPTVTRHSALAKNSSKKLEKTTSVKVRPYGFSLNGSVAAQPFQLAPSAQQRLAPQQRADEDNNVLFSYPTDSQGQGYVIGWPYMAEAFGMDAWASLTDYNVALIVPANYVNAVVNQFQMAFYGPSTITNVKVWCSAVEISDDGYYVFPNSADEADFHESFDDVTATEGVSFYAFNFTEGYTIPEEGCIIGISFTTTAEMPLFYWNASGNSGGFLYQVPIDGEVGFLDMATYGFGNLAAAVSMDVSACPATNVSVNPMPEMTALLNETTVITPVVVNEAASAISSISYVLTVDGEALPEDEVTFSSEVPAGSSAYLNIPYVFTTEGLHTMSVEVTKVDGEPNISTSSSSGDFTVVVLENAAERTSVVEQFTGTWCGYCPRGHVGLKKLKDLYGDKIITLAGHVANGENAPDPMQCDDYFSVVYNFCGNFPSAAFDRYTVSDPYLSPTATAMEFGANETVEAVKQLIPSEATVALSATWADENKTSINANVDYTFGYSRMSLAGANPYGIAFLLSEDGMTGNGDSWLQTNYMSGDANYAITDFMDWYLGGSAVANTYDNVIVGAWDALTGADNSVVTTIAKGVKNNYKASLSLTGNTLIQDKNKLYLTALLINRNNYTIVNAAQVALGDGTVGIENVADGGSNAVEVARYNVNGVRLNAPQKGLNIVKYSDGTSKTVVVK